MFYKSLLIFSVFVVLTLIQDAVSISWNDTFKLTWQHFKGEPNASIPAVAVTASGITFEFSLKEARSQIVGFDTKVFAHFYPEKSWFIKNLGNERILAHEQLHFDITELYARKFRKQISELKSSDNIKSQLQTLYKHINKQLEATQNRYDRETDNSVNVEFQAKWVAYVNNELKKLEAYKSKK